MFRQIVASTLGVLAIGLTVAACGGATTDSQPLRSPPKALQTACTQLVQQPSEKRSEQPGWAEFYAIPPSLVTALKLSGNAALVKLGDDLVESGSNPMVVTPVPKEFDAGQALCHSLIR
jgi:hypothetical protein